MVNVDKLLKKKSWTGRELGQLQIANALTAYKKAVESGKQDEKGIIDREIIDKMVLTIKDAKEFEEYSGYISIYEWLMTALQMAYAQEQQAQLQFEVMVNRLTNAWTAEELYSYISELPVIMTKKQYNDTVNKRTQEILKPNGEPLGMDILQIIFNAIEFYVALAESKPRAKNPLKPLKKKLATEIITAPSFLKRYNKVYGLGYYTTEDGIRSDSVTSTEWRDIVNPLISKYFEEEQIDEELAELIKEEIVQKRTLTDATISYLNGLPTEEAQKKRREEEIKQGLLKRTTWHYYEDVPEDINKWELLVDEQLFEFFSACYEDDTQEDAMELCRTFYDEFKDVIEAILTDAETRYSLFKGISSIPVEEWLNTVYSWEELYNANCYNFRGAYLGNASIFDGNKRAIFNGIAIIEPTWIGGSKRIDKETGYYMPPNIWEPYKELSLEGLFDDAESHEEEAQRICIARDVFISSFYFIKAFNETLDLIISMYGIEEMKFLKRDIPYFEERVKSFNELLYRLSNKILDTEYENKETKEKKLKVLKDILCPIDITLSDVPKERIRITKNNMKNFKAFNSFELNPTNTLCMYIPNYNGEGA